MIYYLPLLEGRPVTVAPNIHEQLAYYTRIQEDRIELLRAGLHNLTPQGRKNLACIATIEVLQDGRGIVRTIARTPDLVTIDIDFFAGRIQGPKPGDRTFRLPEEGRATGIVGADAPGQALIFGIVYYVSEEFAGGWKAVPPSWWWGE